MHCDLLWLAIVFRLWAILNWNLVAVSVFVICLRRGHRGTIVLEWIRTGLHWGSSGSRKWVVNIRLGRASRGWLWKGRSSASWLRGSMSSQRVGLEGLVDY